MPGGAAGNSPLTLQPALASDAVDRMLGSKSIVVALLSASALAMLGGIAPAEEPVLTSPAQIAAGIDFFEKQVRPVLAQNCLECHGEKSKGGLRLDSREAMLSGGDSGPALAPGNPDDSLLIQAIAYHDDPKMPPAGKLPDKSIDAI